jgi:hypothetical protein
MTANGVTAQGGPQPTKRFGTILRVNRQDRTAAKGGALRRIGPQRYGTSRPACDPKPRDPEKLIFSDGSKPYGKRICQKLVHEGVGLPRRRFVPGGDPRYI